MTNPGDWEINDSRDLNQGDAREWEIFGLVPSDEDGAEMDAFLEWFEDATGVSPDLVNTSSVSGVAFCRFKIRAEGLS